ncbi:hypothetical protein [Tenacibaculum discolor]|uniref:DUF4178 domain-containing protein n=2 Tax=Tenacibaculum discolor TaxID=361581 RepID=A0ABT9F551_9FLAO|nr:hypothetical protein [Tenacibaculum discolor]MDP2541750.1 hypothetical protein [Tenacibaculum discolor]PHO01555.1 hypothetical protein CSC82_23030 [Rhodobacteraceae bacterium 4F10]
MKIIKLSSKDITHLKKQIKNDYMLLFFMMVILILFWYLFNDNGIFGKLIIVFGGIGILGIFLNRLAIYQDLIEKKKYSGEFKVIEKIERVRGGGHDTDSGYISSVEGIIYLIKFNDWRIGDIRFEKEYWEKVSEGDFFKIEQAINSQYVLEISRGGEDFNKAVTLDYNDRKSSLDR